MDPIKIVLGILLVIVIVHNIRQSRRIIKKNEELASLKGVYGLPLLESAFEAYKAQQLVGDSVKAFFAAESDKFKLPEVPETCPHCGAKYSGGHAAPGDKMVLGMRQFYTCGASIAVLKDEIGWYVRLKNCASLGKSFIKYPVFHGELVKIKAKHIAGTPEKDGNPLAEKAEIQKVFQLDLMNVDGRPNLNGDVFPRSAFIDEFIANKDTALEISIGEPIFSHVLRSDEIKFADPPIKLRDIMIPGRCSGSIPITKMKFRGKSLVRSLTEGTLVMDTILSLKKKLRAVGVEPEVVLFAPDVFEKFAKECDVGSLLKLASNSDNTLQEIVGLSFNVLNNLPRGTVYVTTHEEADFIRESLEGASGPGRIVHSRHETSVEAMNEVLHEQYDKEEEDD